MKPPHRRHLRHGASHRVRGSPVVGKYKMTVDLSVLDSLGINLYSNAAAVLSELVANAYDADATQVEITWNQGIRRHRRRRWWRHDGQTR